MSDAVPLSLDVTVNIVFGIVATALAVCGIIATARLGRKTSRLECPRENMLPRFQGAFCFISILTIYRDPREKSLIVILQVDENAFADFYGLRRFSTHMMTSQIRFQRITHCQPRLVVWLRLSMAHWVDYSCCRRCYS